MSSTRRDAATPRVAVYRSPLLPLSETFIRDQVRAMHRWNATLFGETLYDPRPALDGVTHQALWRDTPMGRALRRTDRVLEQVMGYSPAKHRALRNLRPDLVHVHFATDAVQAWPTLRRLGVPVVVTLHGYDINTHADWWRAGHGGPRMRDYPERLRAMAADPSVHFIAVSQAIRRAALAQGVGDERMSIRHIGIPTQNFPVDGPPPSQRRPDVLFVGRLVEKKGAVVLLDALDRVGARPERTVVVGDGPLRAALESRAGSGVTFVGAKGKDDLAAEYARAGIALYPSVPAANGDRDGLPVALLEAMAAGCAVVASAVPGIVDVVQDGENGLLVPPGDPAALATALERLLGDADLVRRLGAAAARTAQAHTVPAVADRYRSLLREARGV